MATITITIDNHIEERGDGTVIEWPAYDLVANPGDIVLANTDSEPDGLHYAVEQLDDAGAPVVIQFGAYYDPSVTPVPFVETGTPTGTFPLTLGGVSYTGTFAGPYAAIPPRLWDLDDDGLMWAERMGKISYNADPATGVYAITQESSTDPQIHSDHIHDDAVHEGKTHPSGPHRSLFHGLRTYFTGTDYIDPANHSIGYKGVLNVVPKTGATPDLRDSTGRLIHQFSPGFGQSLDAQNGYHIVYNPLYDGDYVPPGGQRDVSVPNYAGDLTYPIVGPIPPGAFAALPPDADLGSPNGLLLYKLGRVDEMPDDNTGELHMVSHHSGVMEYGGQHIGQYAVSHQKMNAEGNPAGYIMATLVDGEKDANWRDPRTVPGIGQLKRVEVPHPSPGSDITPDANGTLYAHGTDGFQVWKEDAHTLGIHPPLANANGDILVWNAVDGAYEPLPNTRDIISAYDGFHHTAPQLQLAGKNGFSFRDTEHAAIPNVISMQPPRPSDPTATGLVMTWVPGAPPDGEAGQFQVLPPSSAVIMGTVTVTGDGLNGSFVVTPWPAGTFTSAPHVIMTARSVAGGSYATAGVLTGFETTSGFTIIFNQAPPNGNQYHFTYIAMQ